VPACWRGFLALGSRDRQVVRGTAVGLEPRLPPLRGLFPSEPVSPPRKRCSRAQGSRTIIEQTELTPLSFPICVARRNARVVRNGGNGIDLHEGDEPIRDHYRERQAQKDFEARRCRHSTRQRRGAWGQESTLHAGMIRLSPLRGVPAALDSGQRRQRRVCGARTRAVSLKAIFELSDVAEASEVVAAVQRLCWPASHTPNCATPFSHTQPWRKDLGPFFRMSHPGFITLIRQIGANAFDQFRAIDTAQRKQKARHGVETRARAIERRRYMFAHAGPIGTRARHLDFARSWKQPIAFPAHPFHHVFRELSL
jgi:hypothetical protein